MNKPEFRTWFEAQFGKPPTGKTTYDLLQIICEAGMQYNSAQEELSRLETYNATRHAALMAWNARDNIDE